MRDRDGQFIPGLGVLLLAALLMGLIGSLLHDFNEVGYGLFGALLWGGAVLITFTLGIAYLSRRLLPIQGGRGWSEGFRLLWRNYTLGAANLLYGRQSEPVPSASATAKKKSPTASPLSPSFGLIGAGFMLSHEAAAITRGNSYSRADGPGLVFLHPGESIAKIFDLRPQGRRMLVSALTRDGIPVETSVSVSFRVRQPATDQRRPRSVESDVLPYPYDREALFDLLYSTSYVGDDKYDWTEQVCPQAATLLVTEIAKYTLDELLVSGGSEPLSEIRDRIKTALKEQQTDDQLQTLPKGIEILGVGVGGLQLPQDVTEKRLSTWQVEWRNRIAEEMVIGDIEAQRVYQQARAQAQVENIENLLLSIEAMRRESGIELHEVVMVRIMEVLEALSVSRAVSPLTSPAAFNGLGRLADETSNELRRALAEGEEPH